MSHLDEPMIPADYGSPQMTREMLISWGVPEIAADREAVLAVLVEYGYRMFLEGEKPFKHLANLAVEADTAVSAKILNVIKAKQEVRGV